MSDKRILVVIVTYCDAPYIHSCLESLLASSSRDDLDIVVYDNASTDDTLSRVIADPAITIMKSTRNLGYAAANNVAFKHAFDPDVHEWLFLLNADAQVAFDTISELSSFLLASPRY